MTTRAPTGEDAKMRRIAFNPDGLMEFDDTGDYVFYKDATARIAALEAENARMRDTEQKFGVVQHDLMTRIEALEAELTQRTHERDNYHDATFRLADVAGAQLEQIAQARIEGERIGRAALADAVSRLLADPDMSTHALLYRIGQLVDAAAAPGTEDRQ
jgi:hypothetical protein